jgi:hypothetical protein
MYKSSVSAQHLAYDGSAGVLIPFSLFQHIMDKNRHFTLKASRLFTLFVIYDIILLPVINIFSIYYRYCGKSLKFVQIRKKKLAKGV